MITTPADKPHALPKAFQAWAAISLCLMFSLLILHPSRSAAMNIMDGVFFLPALFLLPVMLWRLERPLRPVLVAALPLLLFTLYGLVSIFWSDTPNPSRSIRATLQVTALFLLFSYLFLSNNREFLERLLFWGCLSSALACAWHLTMFYGVAGAPLGQSLYAGVPDSQLNALGLHSLNSITATLVAAPQAAMLAALTYRQKQRWLTLVGVIAVAILVAYLIALERRTGQVAMAATLVTALIVYRNRFWTFAALTLATLAGMTLLFFPELILSRGASWRPGIWLAAWEQGLNAPLFGHGLSNTMPPVTVPDPESGGLQHFHHPHNMALSVFYYMGGVGVLLWFLLWLPGLGYRLFFDPLRRQQSIITFPLAAGCAALVFDGGYALAAFDFDWFCFWFPVALLLASFTEPASSDVSRQ